MRRTGHILILAAFMVFLMLPLGVGDQATPLRSDADVLPLLDDGSYQVAGDQDSADWWNSTYVYRRYYNFTEPGVTSRTLTPVHLYLSFSDDHCYRDSIRVGHYDTPGWSMLPFQLWNTTYDSTGNYIESTRVSFMVNVSQGQKESNYYIYYAKIDVGSVSYPDFYPFIYKSYTFSLINLVSYYDDNNYFIEMWDGSLGQWDDPRNLDARWDGTIGSVVPSDVPSGTLDKFEYAQYEPSSYSYTLFHGYYAVYSNYPLAVTMGQGNVGSNPAINDWYPGVNQLSSGIGTEFILGGVEGFESWNEGKYWVQATLNNTEVYVWTSGDVADTGWKFSGNNSPVTFPAVLKAGEYISKRDVVYPTYMKVNSTKPVSVHQGDSDCSYARDIWAFYSAITGALAGEEFYTIDMGNANDRTRVTNLGDTAIQVDWWRDSGSGWGTKNTLTINANSSQLIGPGTASLSDQEDVLHIKGPVDSMLMVEGVYNPGAAIDAGDWVPTITGHRFGTNLKIWGRSGYKFMIVATENALVDITGYNDGQLEIPAGGMAAFRPLSSSPTLYHITSNASVGVVDLGRFSTSSPYSPILDTGYGWQVPAYVPEQDQKGFSIDLGEERHLFEFDITVIDLDGVVVSGATVTLYNASTHAVWEDEQFKNRTGTTDSNGFIVFEGLSNGTYEVRTRIDAALWLATSTSITNVWVTDVSNHSIVGSVTPVTITLNMASLDIHLDDLTGSSMDDTLDEDIYMRACNDTGDDSIYVHQAQANSTGWLRFPRIPQDDYYFRARYAGEHTWNSYGFDDLLKFANWSVSASDFTSGSFTMPDWKLPLITVQIHVHSWDDRVVPGAFIRLNNSVDPLTYVMTECTDSDGNYTFNRIVNGTWSLDVWRNDDFGLKVVNNTDAAKLTDLQGYTSFEVQLRLTKLKIRVQRASSDRVPDATVIVYLNNQTEIAYGQTDDSGEVVFEWIRGNMTSPWFYWYTVDVIKGTANKTRVNVSADWDLTSWNVITLPDPTYPKTYTELTSDHSFEQQYWHLDFVFYIDYFNRTGTEASNEVTNVTYGPTTLIEFKIYSGVVLVGQGNWTTTGSSFMQNSPAWNMTFAITISLDYWMLNITDAAYKIVVSAHTDGYDNPDELVVYLTVNPGQTSYGSDISEISEHYQMHYEHLFWLTDLTNDGNLSVLDTYNYTVKLGLTVVLSGYLHNNGNGTFSLLPSMLAGLEVGEYVLVIDFEKLNYVDATAEIQLTVTEAPMAVVLLNPFNYEWSLGTGSMSFQYLWENSTSPDLLSVAVTIQWINNSTGQVYVTVQLTLDPAGSNYIYDFTRDVVPSGNWDVNVTCSKANYASAWDYYAYFLVTDAETGLCVVTIDPVTVEWGSDATFEVVYNRTSDGAGLPDAASSHNWSRGVSVDHLGSGHYLITVDTLIESGSYALLLEMSLANHQTAVINLNITIRIPLQIESDYNSIESPLEAYWTHNFSLSVILKDQSTNQPITGATVTYSWYLEFVVNLDGDLDSHSGGIYNTTLNGWDAVPLEDLYSIVITATMAGCTEKSTIIFLRINEVPNEIVLETEYFEAFYADMFDIRFYWNNTLDNASIDYADAEAYYLLTLGKSITTGVNEGGGWYHFAVDTMDLEMNANVQGSVYVIRITTTRSGYQAHELTAVIVLVRETDASLVIDAIGLVNWSDSFQVTANLYDAHPDHGHMLVWDGAVVTISYGTLSTQMTNNGDGTFSATIQSETWFSASSNPYNLTFTYTLQNYVDSMNMSAVVIVPIPGLILRDAPTETPLEYTWGTSFELKVRVNNIYGAAPESLVDAAVFYLWSDHDSLYPLLYRSGAFNYNVSVLTTQVPAGSYYLIVRVVNENLTIPDLEVPITVVPVSTTFESETSRIDVIQGVDETTTVTLTYLDEQSNALDDATVYYEWAGLTRYGSYSAGVFVCEFNPSGSSLTVPGTYILTFHAGLQNYTSKAFNVTLVLNAATEMRADDVILESDQTLTLYFMFWDFTNGAEVPTDVVTSVGVILPGGTQVTPTVGHDTNGYYVILTADQIGEIRTEGYDIILVGIAPGYQNHTQSVYAQSVEITIIEPQVFIPLLSTLIGPIPRSMLILTGFLVAIFGVLVGSAVALRRWRVPFLIKQMNKALKAVESGKRAKVENIKTMGGVISDVLAPGLAALDIAAPIIDEVTEGRVEEILGEDTEELLGELDALDEIGADEVEAPEETPDFEAELAAEIETVTEETPEPEEPIETPAEVDEPVAELEEPKPESEEIEAEAVEPEIEESEPAIEEIPEDIEEELASEDLPKEDELPESELDLETPVEEEVELEPESTKPESRTQLTKRELIEQLPSEVKESMSEEEIRKLSKKELLTLIDSTEESDTSE